MSSHRGTAQRPHPAAGPFFPVRDAAELELCRHALAAGLPVLGICRGLQLINVALGGTLHQHLPDVVGNDSHSPQETGYGSHKVSVAPGSQLAAILGRSEAAVPTHHHQAIDALGAGLIATAWADDGVIEAAELAPGDSAVPPARFMVAVQWHPEVGEDPSLFRALVAAAGQRRQEPPAPDPARASSGGAHGGRLRAESARCPMPSIALYAKRGAMLPGKYLQTDITVHGFDTKRPRYATEALSRSSPLAPPAQAYPDRGTGARSGGSGRSRTVAGVPGAGARPAGATSRCTNGTTDYPGGGRGNRLHVDARAGLALQQCLPPELLAAFQATCGRASTRLTVVSERLRVLKEVRLGDPAADRYAPGTLSTSANRLTLREVLAAGLDDAVVPGREVTGYDTAGNGVRVHFADGREAEADVLVGADGVN